MKKPLNIMLCVLAAVFMSSCSKPTHDSLAEDMVVNMEKLATAIESAKDVDSAKKAAADIKKISADMKELKTQMDELGKPSEEKDKELEEKYKERMTKAMGKIMGAGLALAKNPEAAKILQDSMKDLEGVMGGSK